MKVGVAGTCLLCLLAATAGNQVDVQRHQLRRTVQKRCRGTVGGWCGHYDLQAPQELRSVPRGSKSCPSNCNGVGNCNHDTGLCECPAGWQGEACEVPLKRPCTHRFRDKGDVPVGNIDADGRDLDPLAEGFTESRCIGICDSDVARCFCDGKYKPVPAPPGSAPGTPPLKRGRPLGNHLCQPNDDGKGHALPWGQVPWKDLYGPEGWCEADTPSFHCPCMYDGFGGPLCDQVLEMVCPNQCSGHGECNQGFCKCHDGWYGTDCMRKKQGLQVEQGVETHRQWLEHLVKLPPAALEGSDSSSSSSSGGDSKPGNSNRSQRKRPFIYIYDLPAAYNARMLQYRVEKGVCTWRAFQDNNVTTLAAWTYAIETLFHEMLLQSEHRTFDPEEADFFYMPLYSSCFIFPIHCWADGPWWYAPSGPRVMHVTNMMLEARDWVRTHFPYWDRHGGLDHIWLMSHDEGACYAPTEIYNVSIFLTHWGRMDLHHESNTAFTPDNYTQEFEHEQQPGGWLRLIKGHPCYTPGKDLVIPSLKFGFQFASSPLLAAPSSAQDPAGPARGPLKRGARDILAFFRGDVGKHRLPHYSRGIRQKLHGLAAQGRWNETYAIYIGDGEEIPGSYSSLLSRSMYCLVLPGDGWSARAEDAVLHGCVPVVIMDEVHAVFEPQLDWRSFSIRIKEKEVEQLPALLKSIPEQAFKKLQATLRTVWHRFAYTRHPLLSNEVDRILAHNLARWEHGERRKATRRRGVLGTRASEEEEDSGEDKERGWAEEAADDTEEDLLFWKGDEALLAGDGANEGLLEPSQVGAGRRRALQGEGADQQSPSGTQQPAAGAPLAKRFPHEDDAFGTIMQWLYHKMVVMQTQTPPAT